MNILATSYKATVALTQRFLIVVLDTAEKTCRLPTSAADRKLALGVAQQTAVADQMVEVRELGHSFMIADGAIAIGDYITANVTGATKGYASAHARPTKGDAGGGDAADIDLVRDFVDDMQDYQEGKCAKALQAASAEGDIIEGILLQH